MTNVYKTENIIVTNSTFAIDGVSISADSFMVRGNALLRMSICAKKPAHRKSANR